MRHMYSLMRREKTIKKLRKGRPLEIPRGVLLNGCKGVAGGQQGDALMVSPPGDGGDVARHEPFARQRRRTRYGR